MNVQWYPGHMTKAKRMMQENIKLIDLVIELVDARVPSSSRNPDLDEMGKGKARVVLLNKADLANERLNDAWEVFFREKGFYALTVNSKKNGGMKQIHDVIAQACKEKTERDRKRGIQNRPVRAMVVGIPNVGKSTFINAMARKAAAKTGNKPGVTRGKQWIRLNRQVELLDTPGLLWPKFEDPAVGMRLALIGSIRDELLDTRELSAHLIRTLCADDFERIKEKYRIEGSQDPYLCLEQIAQARHCVAKGNEPDIDKASAILVEDFRGGRLGRITLESPDERIKGEGL